MSTLTKTETASYKVGLNRGRRRVWIDGKRLTDAGFIGGTSYNLTVTKGCMILTLGEFQAGQHHQMRKVTGRPTGKPLVDISGATVDAAFGPEVARISATFESGIITITAEGANT